MKLKCLFSQLYRSIRTQTSLENEGGQNCIDVRESSAVEVSSANIIISWCKRKIGELAHFAIKIRVESVVYATSVGYIMY